MNRSIWESGRSWVPEAPAGFWVAMTRKGWGHRVGHPVHRHLPLLHGLQQGGLGAAGGPVELVGQKEVAQHRAGLVLHPARLLVVEGEARDVRRHHVGGELDPVVPEAQGLGEGQGHGGLAHAGNVLQQDVAPGQNGQQHLCQYLVLAHHGAAHLAQNGGGQLAPLHGNALLIICLTLHSSRALIYVNEKELQIGLRAKQTRKTSCTAGFFVL